MVTFQEDTKLPPPTKPLSSPTTSVSSVPQEPAFQKPSLRDRVRASLRYTRESLSTGNLFAGMGTSSSGKVNFGDQIDLCKAAPSGSGRHARKSEMGEMLDIEFSEDFVVDDGRPKNSDEAKELQAQQAAQQQKNNLFGFAWGSTADTTTTTTNNKSPTGSGRNSPLNSSTTKQQRRDSSGSASVVSTNSATSFMSNLWSTFSKGSNNNNNSSSSNLGEKEQPQSKKIESALGKLDRMVEDNSDSENDAEDSGEMFFKNVVVRDARLSESDKAGGGE